MRSTSSCWRDAVLGRGQDLLDLAVGAGEALGLGEREVGADGAGRALGRAEEELADERVVLAAELGEHARPWSPISKLAVLDRRRR